MHANVITYTDPESLRSAIEARAKRLDEPCWVWQGEISRGYGRVWWTEDGQHHRKAAHRVYYELINGPVDPAMQLDHLCLNKACVNPSHLEVVTPGENIRRARQTCAQGHAYTGSLDYRGRRQCVICLQAKRRRKYLARRLREGKPAGVRKPRVPIAIEVQH